jgi:WD40 repeat protein
MIGRPITLRNPDKKQRFDYGYQTHRVVVAPTPNAFEVRDVTSMKPVGPPVTTESMALAFLLSPDGRVLATGHPDWTLRLWKVETGEPLGEPMKADGWIDQLRFSEDSRLVAAADRGAHVRVWDTQTQRQIGPIMKGDALIAVMDISPDNSTLAIGTGDGHIQLFDIASGVQFGPAWTGHTDVMASLDFNPDGSRLVSAGADGTVRMWPVPNPDPQALCAKITQNMSRADWDFWVSPDIPYVKTCTELPVAGETE